MEGFSTCLRKREAILMEGALSERLKREYGSRFDSQVAMAKLIYQPPGAAALAELWRGYIDIARRYGLPFLATTPTRRANRERARLARCPKSLFHDNVAFLRALQQESGIEMYVGGLMGCCGDAYTGAGALGKTEARDIHSWQAEGLAQAGADFLYAGIMPTLPEAAGMAQAMAATGLPYMISFTIQRDGRLIDGTPIADAIAYIDDTAAVPPACYMTNCVHPRIVREALLQPCNQTGAVRHRFRGVQANTSPLSYAELDGASELHTSEPDAFALELTALRNILPIQIFGGCCGTDHRHMEAVARILASPL